MVRPSTARFGSARGPTSAARIAEPQARSRSPWRAGVVPAKLEEPEFPEDWDANSHAPDVPDSNWSQSWDDGGVVPAKMEEPEFPEDWDANSHAPDVPDSNWSQSWDDGGKEPQSLEDWDVHSRAPDVPDSNGSQSWGDGGVSWNPQHEEQVEEDQETNSHAPENSNWSQSWDDGGWSRKEDWKEDQDWSDWKTWKSDKEGWKGDWKDSWKSKDSKDTKRSRGNGGVDVPAVLYAQAYISDIPVEFDEKMVKDMHRECDVQLADLPISVKFLPSKDKTGETCACIVRYAKQETLEWVLNTMHGKQLRTRSGKIKKVGVKKARPARWMVQAGLAQEEEPPPQPAQAAEQMDVVAAPQKVWLDELVQHEGTIMQWYSSQASGFIRTLDGVDLYARSNQFSKDDKKEIEIGRRVTFQARWSEDKNRYEARSISLMKPTAQFPTDLPDGPPLPVPGKPQHYEAVAGVEYFCDMWNLNDATVRWLRKLHPDVQERLISEYDDSFVPTPLEPGQEVVLHKSCSVAVGGLHSSITEEVLWNLFSRFGEVKSCRFLGSTAVMEMQDEEEAELAVQDLMVSSDWPGALIAYFYHATPPVRMTELPECQRIFGIVKKWNRLTGSGFIAVNGAGPDLPIRTDMLEDVAILIPGAPVLFMVEHKYLNWFDSPHAEILRCMADRESVRQHISTTFGTEMAVRSFARTLQQELQMGSPDI